MSLNFDFIRVLHGVNQEALAYEFTLRNIPFIRKLAHKLKNA